MGLKHGHSEKQRGICETFSRELPMDYSGTRLTNPISNSKLYEKCRSVPLSRAIMRKRLRWLGRVLRMEDDRSHKIVLIGQPFRAK